MTDREIPSFSGVRYPIDRKYIGDALSNPDKAHTLHALLDYSFRTAGVFQDGDPLIQLAAFMPTDLEGWAARNAEIIGRFLRERRDDRVREHYYILKDTEKYEGSAWLARASDLQRAYPLDTQLRAHTLAVRLLYLQAESAMHDVRRQNNVTDMARTAVNASVLPTEQVA